VVGQRLIGGRHLFSARAAVSSQDHDHQFGEILERDTHETAFLESTIRTAAGRHTLVAGAAVERSAYRPSDLPQFAFTFWIPGVFAQADLELTTWLSMSASGRLDHHNEYGTFFSPRLSARLHSERWSSRVSAGTGFFGPSPLTEETEAAGLSRLVIPDPLRAERGRSLSVDLTHTDGPFTSTVTMFATRVRDPLHVDRENGLVMTNLDDPATTAGVELLGTFRRAILRHRFVHVRAGQGNRGGPRTGRGAHTPSQRGHRRHVGTRRRGTSRRGVVSDRGPAPGREPVPIGE
jgi:iron complex outermembrane receptor protein